MKIKQKRLLKILKYFSFSLVLLMVLSSVYHMLYLTVLNHTLTDQWTLLKNGDVSKTFTITNVKQHIPVKVYTKLGLEYFCTIELVDSTMIVNNLSPKGEFSYEVLRFHTWMVIKENEPISEDTLYREGMKIYNIEKFTIEKYINKIPYLYLEFS